MAGLDGPARRGAVQTMSLPRLRQTDRTVMADVDLHVQADLEMAAR